MESSTESAQDTVVRGFPFSRGGRYKVASMHGWDVHVSLDPSLEDASFKAPLISHLESRELVL